MKLAQFLYQHDLTDAEFAALIGVSRSLISRYRGGSRIPGKAHGADLPRHAGRGMPE